VREVAEHGHEPIVRLGVDRDGPRAEVHEERWRRSYIHYLHGIDDAEIVETVHARRAPMIPVGATLRVRTTPSAALLVAQRSRPLAS
jgi:hypothetical protein